MLATDALDWLRVLGLDEHVAELRDEGPDLLGLRLVPSCHAELADEVLTAAGVRFAPPEVWEINQTPRFVSSPYNPDDCEIPTTLAA